MMSQIVIVTVKDLAGINLTCPPETSNILSVMTTTTLTKHTITVDKNKAIEQYNDSVLDHIQCDLKASDYEYCEDLINLGRELKRLHDNEFAHLFLEGATMFLLESDDFQLLEDNVDNVGFFFEIVVKDGDRVVETISSDNVTW